MDDIMTKFWEIRTPVITGFWVSPAREVLRQLRQVGPVLQVYFLRRISRDPERILGRNFCRVVKRGN
ncbi:MAG: hypothetical protein QMD46_05930 [Methanomicrobiales archaeon]|nr:hypothetical protein [Methanomicrobiales archaeon]MDI6876194.1 hypothetical protein [Methanomicrobiales archaeon]